MRHTKTALLDAPAHGNIGRAPDVLALHRLARRADGGAGLVHWLARRTGGWAGLLNRSGAVLVGSTPVLDTAGKVLAARGVAAMCERGLRTFAAEDERTAVFLAVDTPDGTPGPVLAFVGAQDVPRPLAADAAMLIGTTWSAQEVRRTRQRVERTESRCREVVLHLLMSRHVATARQIASALSPHLPDPVRVHVVDCGAGERAEVIRLCTELTGRAAWIVPCPVHLRQVIVIAPAPEQRALEAAIASEVDGCVVGAGDAVALRDTATGYEQAFHALAVARGRTERWARFDPRLDLAAIVAVPGLQWATTLLNPLAHYAPPRATDPDAQELLATARSWLAFSTAATRHLKVHRNTVAARLRRIEEILGLDLRCADQQAVLDLALRIRAAPRASEPSGTPDAARLVTLDDLLRTPAVQAWARDVLRPVREGPRTARIEATLRAWLDCNSRLSATAAVLGISVAAARKRIVRLEQLLQRSLLHAPDARHDLWLALHAAELGRRDTQHDAQI